MLNICFTADHEMFFGENYFNAEEVFIKSTYRLMEILERYKVPLCLMTDVCSIIRHRELGVDPSYVSLMDQQLVSAIERGHDVQLHIHPHWMTSKYNCGKWEFDASNYSLHRFGFEGEDSQARKIIVKGKQYLEELLRPVDKSYHCIAFRAGGWCLQPEREFLEALISAGIRIETTVFSGGFIKANTHYYDFRKVPNKPNWWIAPEKGINIEANKDEKGIFEVSTGSFDRIILKQLKKIIYKLYRKQMDVSQYPPLGTGIDDTNKGIIPRFIEKAENFLFQPILFSYDGACAKVLLDLLEYYNARYGIDKKDYYICIIGHPKSLNDIYLEEINKFCATAAEKYSNTTKFIRLQDVPVKNISWEVA